MAADHEAFEERRRSLNDRGHELAAELDRLRSGASATAMDPQRAKRALASALRHSADAHAWAAGAYHRAAMAHRRTAEYADRVGEHDRAAEHRAAAEADDEAAEIQARAAEADRAASKEDSPNYPPPQP